MHRLPYVLAVPALLALPLALAACDSTELEPGDISRAFVTRVIVDEVPLRDVDNENNGWDGGGDGEADVYVRLIGSGDNELFGEGDAQVVASPNEDLDHYDDTGTDDLPVTFSVSSYEIDVLERALTIEVKDDDSDALPPNPDDDIGVTEEFRLEDYVPSSLGDEPTTTIPLESADGAVQVRLTVRWAD